MAIPVHPARRCHHECHGSWWAEGSAFAVFSVLSVSSVLPLFRRFIRVMPTFFIVAQPLLAVLVNLGADAAPCCHSERSDRRTFLGPVFGPRGHEVEDPSSLQPHCTEWLRMRLAPADLAKRCHPEELGHAPLLRVASDEGSAFAFFVALASSRHPPRFCVCPPFTFKGGPLLILAFSCALINRLIAP